MILSFCKTETNQEWLILHVRLCVSHEDGEEKKEKLLLMQKFPSLESDEDLFGEMSTTNFWVLNLCGLSQEVNRKRNDAEIKFPAVRTIYQAESGRHRNWKSPRYQESSTFSTHTLSQQKTLRKHSPFRFEQQTKTNCIICRSSCYDVYIEMYTRNFPEDRRQLFGGKVENITADDFPIRRSMNSSFFESF